MPRTPIGVAILLVAAWALAGCSVTVNAAPQGARSVTEAATPSPRHPSTPALTPGAQPPSTPISVPAPAGQSGVRGVTVVDPCPVVTDPPCPPKPIAARLSVMDSGFAVIAVVTSASDGHFSLTLRPGRYELRAAATTGPARPTPAVKVLVRANQFTVVTIYVDIGIR